MMFVGSGWGLEPGTILYTSHFLFSVYMLVSKDYLGDPYWSLMEENSLDAGLAGSVGNSIFYP